MNALHPTLTPTEFGYLVQETDAFVVELWRYMFNWRLVSMVAGQQETVERGYCFFGTDQASFMRAALAGQTWEDPLRSDPPDFDKRAFPNPAMREDIS